jgi:hypothetical protein
VDMGSTAPRRLNRTSSNREAVVAGGEG